MMTPRQAQETARRLVRQLTDERERRGLESLDIALRSGLGASVISHNSQGKCSPRLTTIIRWADALGRDLRLVKRTDEGTEP